jgi:hypothetical protein
MGKSYNIKRNVPEPSSEEIKKFMDFDALLQLHTEGTQRNTGTAPEGARIRNFTSPREGQYSGRMRRWMVMGAGLATAAAVALLLIVRPLGDLPTPEQSQAVADAYFAQKPLLNPLLSTSSRVRPISIDAAAGATLDLAEGARLVIPRTAFQTDRGTLIESGEVDIYYRELHDAVDFFMAGVPMTYDSAGTRHYLQSAGMIEIIALQNGQKIGLAPGKTIRIELQSTLAPQAGGAWPNFKVYHLDTVARNWQYFGQSKLFLVEESTVENGAASSLEAKIAAEKAALLSADPQPEAPLKPIRPDSKAISFELNLKSGEIPIEAGSEEVVAELKSSDDVWQVLPNCPPFNPNDLNLEWQSVRLKHQKEGGYELTLLSGAKQLRLLAQPVMTNSDYVAATKKYNEALAQYEKDLAEWEVRNAAQIKEIEERYRHVNTPELEKTTAARKVRHVFDINALGFWNCDRPAPLAQSSFRIRLIEDQNGQTFPNQTAYLSDQDGHSIYQLHTGRGSTVYFDKNKEYLLWMLTPEGKLALVETQAQWAESNPRKGLKLKVQTSNQTIRSEADMRKALNVKSEK